MKKCQSVEVKMNIAIFSDYRDKEGQILTPQSLI